MNALDEMTLMLLSSKKKYNNYLANAKPDKMIEVRAFYDKIAKFRPKIQTLLGRYLNDPTTQTTNEVDDAIENCLRTIVKHLEIRDYENRCPDDETDSSEEEEVVLFGEACATEDTNEDDATEVTNEDANEAANEDEVSNKESTNKTTINTSSYWGGRVNKQQSSLDSFIRKRTPH